MEYFGRGKRAERIEHEYRAVLLESWRRPRARIDAGAFLSRTGMATSCQDTSDGLKAAIETICSASECGAVVRERDIPVPNEVAAVSEVAEKDPLALVFGDSVDFELVFTVPGSLTAAFERAAQEARLHFYRIGELTESPDVIFEFADGHSAALPGNAWRHAPDAPGV